METRDIRSGFFYLLPVAQNYLDAGEHRRIHQYFGSRPKCPQDTAGRALTRPDLPDNLSDASGQLAVRVLLALLKKNVVRDAPHTVGQVHEGAAVRVLERVITLAPNQSDDPELGGNPGVVECALFVAVNLRA